MVTVPPFFALLAIAFKRTWEEVFGRPVKKGARLEDAKRRRKLAPIVWDKVGERHAAGEPLNKELFDAIGEELKCGGTLVYELYAETRDFFLSDLGP
jgi:hypothetical protein